MCQPRFRQNFFGFLSVVQTAQTQSNVVKAFALLGCYAALVCVWLPTFRDGYRFHFQCLQQSNKNICLLLCLIDP
jgi:hypothetical protein